MADFNRGVVSGGTSTRLPRRWRGSALVPLRARNYRNCPLLFDLVPRCQVSGCPPLLLGLAMASISSSSNGVWAKRQPKSNFVHFYPKILTSSGNDSNDFPDINWPNLGQFKHEGIS